MTREIFYFLIFPGLLFAGVIGGFLSWVDRKITARVQFRQGPPLFQPMYDFVKLLAKETIIPKYGSPLTFLLSPVFALFGATLAAVFILLPIFGIDGGFSGDLIVIIYVLNIPSVTYIIGGLASGNPLAAVGASREMKLILSYELPFLLVLTSIIIKAGMTISLSEIIDVQISQGAFIGSISGILGFITVLLCVQAKLGLVPFDMAEAEGEICDGIMIESSGTVLAIYKLVKYIMFLVLPALICGLFLGGLSLVGINILWSVLKVLLVVLLITLIRNTNPRVRIKQAMRFFWIWMNLFAVVSIILSIYGL
ncbi:MAG: NADH-quinone oxidoreductase subunit H [Candidatus Stygibacter australis]|nr:NADH-quinone oxidoreductase subunit H [Candidatus Stygibacter australis]MDP8322294.1 NADH-quinone oxidoreductase subunit H [Candidatus Stygibacter australis]